MADLAERVVRVRLLLETLEDPYAIVRGSLVPDSGPAASRYVPCGACGGRGERRARGGWVFCLSCDGRGERRRERGEEAWDAYIGLPLAEANELPRQPAVKRQLPEEAYEQTYTWERLRQSYDRHGSYRQIRVQLDWLSLAAPLRHGLVKGVLVNHEPKRLDRRMRAELDLGVVMIARRIPTVRVPPWLIERSRASERRNTIEALAADGFTAGEIARRTGIPKRTVRKKLGEIRLRSAGTAA